MDDLAAEDLLAELDLAATPAGPPVTKEPLYIRDLTAEDVKSTTTRAAYGSQPGNLIQKIRAPHHTLARLVAEGKKHPECAVITGYTVEYIVMLERDPAFQELIAYYQENVSAAYVNVHERLASLGTLALEILQERLSDPAQVVKMTAGALREIMNDALDRSVAPSKVNQGGGMGSGHDLPRAININFVSAPTLPTGPDGKRLPQAGELLSSSSHGAGELSGTRLPALIDITPNALPKKS